VVIKSQLLKKERDCNFRVADSGKEIVQSQERIWADIYNVNLQETIESS
jgi:hypothetical protein